MVRDRPFAAHRGHNYRGRMMRRRDLPDMASLLKFPFATESLPSTMYAFSETYIGQSPDDAGIYWLWRGAELIYVGIAAGGVTIRSRLSDHFSGRSCSCSRQATHYFWELVLRPAERHSQILKAMELMGILPVCNRHAAHLGHRASPLPNRA